MASSPSLQACGGHLPGAVRHRDPQPSQRRPVTRRPTPCVSHGSSGSHGRAALDRRLRRPRVAPCHTAGLAIKAISSSSPARGKPADFRRTTPPHRDHRVRPHWNQTNPAPRRPRRPGTSITRSCRLIMAGASSKGITRPRGCLSRPSSGGLGSAQLSLDEAGAGLPAGEH